MTQPDDNLDSLLQEIRRTISANRSFIKQLQDDSIDDEAMAAEDAEENEAPDEEEFEEL